MSNTELLTKMVRIARVWAEHHEPDTIGIGEDRPRISWSFAGDDRNWEQICYEVEAKHDDGRLSSVTIESSQSRLVPWPFRPLSSRERVEVRVRVAGTANSRSDWSSPLVIEAGLLRSDDWSGCQLILNSTAMKLHNAPWSESSMSGPSDILPAATYKESMTLSLHFGRFFSACT